MVTQLSFYLQRGKAAGEVANAGKHKLFERESKTKYILSATLAITLDFLADYNYQSDKRIAIKQEMKRPCAMAIYAHVHVTEAEKNVTEWNQSTVLGIFRNISHLNRNLGPDFGFNFSFLSPWLPLPRDGSVEILKSK